MRDRPAVNLWSLCVVILLVGIAAVPPAARAQGGPVSDDFHSPTLNTSLWTYINPRGDSPLTMNGTNAVISVPGGVNHELWINTTTAPRLMQAVGNVNFQVEAKFDSGLVFQAHGTQEQGIMVEQDSQNYIRFALFSGSNSSIVYVATFAAGQPTTVTYTAIPLANGQAPVWMRVQRAGSTWTMSWSTNGSTYTTGSTFSYGLTVSQIGPYAANAGDALASAPAFTASIDYFFNTASPIVPEDGGVDITPTSVSASPSLTGAAISWITADWSSSRVDYGTTSAYGATVSNPALVTSHSLNITGLSCATTYHYQVTSADSAGSSESSTDATFTTSACGTGGSGPTISNVVVTPGVTSATIGWITNVAATSRVDYGLSSSYSVMNSNSTLVTTHSLSLTGLTCGTQYHYKITSVDSSGNSNSTADSTFTTAACGTGGSGPVSDDFHSPTLNTSLWTYINPRGDSPLTMNGTNAVISVPGGVNHELWINTTTAPRLMQAVGNVNFQVEAKFDSGLVFQAHGTQEQGVMVEQDSQNYIRFALFSGSNSSIVYVATFAAGQPTTVTYTAIPLANGQAPVWMRVQRAGSTWTMSWSTNGSTYTTGSTFSYGLTVSQIGPYAANAGDALASAPAFTASIDYFFNTASPIVPEDGGVDITPTSVSASPSLTGAAISWITADWSSSRVDYGTTSAYGATVSNPALVTSHSLNITGLSCATTYHYQVTSADSAGSSESSTDATFTTSACGTGGSGPTISNVVVTPGVTSATIGWITNVAATSRVDYGLSSSYSVMNSNSTLVTTHSLSLTGLTCGTQYHYKISSVDSSGNSNSTADSTFATAACGGPVSDDFHGSTLNTSLWTFVAPCCGFLRMNGTDALLVVPAVTNHDPWVEGDHAVRLMQPTANVDFEVEVKFDSSVSPNYQEEGVIVEQDNNTFLRFDLHSGGSLFSAAISNGIAVSGTVKSVSLSTGNGPFWMRVKRVGDTWTQSWSTNGVSFSVGNVITYHMTANRIGPFGGNAGISSTGTPAPSFTAAVDYFFNTAAPVSPRDGGMPQPPNQPVINIWYGDSQTFGQNGIPQQWVNVLGNVSAPSGIQSASYTLNGGGSQFLRVGPNGSRLVDTGDFNVEIDHASLVSGPNTVVITATDNQNHTTTHTVTVNWNYVSGHVWPLPYSIDWSTVTNIQNVAQIVDGQWALQPDGSVRTMQTGDDRLIALGDVSWTDYQVTAEITINSLDCSYYALGLVFGWKGHTTDPTQPQPDQPRTGHPFFGFGTYSTPVIQPPPVGVLNIYANSPSFNETVLVQDTTGITLVPGVKYIMKFAVERNSANTSSHLSLKIWPASATEPNGWNLQADGNASTGSVLLGAHHADVRYGKITVVALP